MTKFETIGINIQMSSHSKDDALQKFNYSCNLCCTKGMRIECERCGIAVVHSQIMAIYDDKEAKAV